MKKLYKKETFKSRDEWLKARSFGGSSASAILDANPYLSKMELLKACSNPQYQKKDTNKNSAMQYGIDCENLIRKMFALDFEDKYTVKAPKNYEMYRRIDKPYLSATLDGILIDKETGDKLILEIKTHDVRNRVDAEKWVESIPQNYFIQCLHYLLVMNDFTGVCLTAKLRYFDYSGKKRKLIKQEILYYYIYRDEQLDQLEYLEKKETEFYEEYVIKKKLPSIKLKF